MVRFLMSVALCVTILAGLNTAEAAGRGKSGGKAASKRRAAKKIEEPKRARSKRSEGHGKVNGKANSKVNGKVNGKVNVNTSGNASGGTSVTGNRAGATTSAPRQHMDIRRGSYNPYTGVSSSRIQ
jgi:hypothetical protein